MGIEPVDVLPLPTFGVLPRRTLLAVAALVCLIFLGLLTLANVGEYPHRDRDQQCSPLLLSDGTPMLNANATGVICRSNPRKLALKLSISPLREPQDHVAEALATRVNFL
jgi:hypothetical protein